MEVYMENNKHVMMINDLPQNRFVLKKIFIKPYVAIYSILVAGIALIVFRTQVWILGLLMIALSLFALFFVNNHLQLEVCDDFAILYLDNHPNECQVFHWNEVNEWGVKHEANGDYLTVQMKDGSILHTSINNSSAVYRALNKMMPKQESSYRLHERINAKRNEPSKFKRPWQRKKK